MSEKTVQMVIDFNGLLNEELSVVNDLVQLGLEKQKHIISNDIDKLNELIQKEGHTISKFNRLETGRYEIQEQLAGFYNLQPPEATAQALIDKIQMDDKELAQRLKDSTYEMQAAVNKLKEINNHNNQLIGFSIDYMEFLQSLFEGEVAGVYTYEGQPEEERVYLPGKKILDHRV